MERTVHLDFADGVALLAEMLEVLVLALSVMEEEAAAAAFGLHINRLLNQDCPVVQSSRMFNSPGGRWTG